jgi:ubiquinone/menaquinone biosynthesis C-methylase UbiE
MEKYLSLKGGQKLLEIGFGTGLGIKRFNTKCSNLDFVGIDFSELMYNKAKKKLRREIISGNVKLINKDFSEFEFLDQKFDTVFFVNVIYFWKNYSEELYKIYKILKPKGSLLFHMADRVALEKNALTNTDVFNKHEITSVMAAMKKIGYINIQEFNVDSRKNHSFIKGMKN